MKTISKLGLFLLVFIPLIFCSCSKDCININITNPGGNNSDEGNNNGLPGKLLNVSFRAGTNSYSATRAGTSALQKDRYVTLYCFENLSDFIDSIRYATIRSGVLSPVSGSPLRLYPNRYEFYAVGIGNSSLDPVPFTDINSGLSISTLDNGVDYLAGSIIDEKITQDTNLLLTLSHIATQVIFEVSAPSNNATITGFSDVTITPPSNITNFMSLYSGSISSSTSIMTDQLLDMNVVGNTFNQILLPLRYSGSLTLKFTAYLNNSTNGQAYSTDIEVPNGILKAGNSYVFSIELGESTVSLTNVQVKNWTEVDETGTPITPIPLSL